MYKNIVFLTLAFLNFLEAAYNFDTPIVLNGTLNSNIERKCPSGWASFQRQKGLYCIKVFYPPPYWYTQPQAQAMCNEIGARLAGIETPAERNYIERTAVTYMTNMSLTETRIWIGGVRTVNCLLPNTAQKCSDPRYAFTWSDGNVVGDHEFIWGANQPANQNGQECVQMSVSIFPTTSDQVTGYGRISTLDDVSCDGNKELWELVRYAQIACGQRAPIVAFDTY
ncbi:unnamed protein product [Caenorhabditis angaria]|uniref:C-type lectin domain-containing protein n=1 Tax=Caenorhabditis angaria TaxID=860376 RepID=A0A9P1N719_9PELO|nr:unnamed protein product [Caenorhabditis angaria]